MGGWGYLFIAIIVEVFGTSLLKVSEGFARPLPTGAALLSWAVSLFFFARALQILSVGTAYAVWSGVGTALLVTIGWVVFKQRLDLGAALGILLIIAGVAVLELFSSAQLG